MPNSRLIDGQFAVGDPCWFDLSTNDVSRATEFYSHVFGWRFVSASTALGDDSAAYQLATNGKQTVAGIGQVVAAFDRPTAWWAHFAAPNIGAMIKRVRELGGEADEPVKVHGQGQMAIARDPHGAAFGVWNPRTLRSPALTDTPGTVHWIELHARDPQAVAGFYEKLFGVVAVPVESKQGDEPGGTLNLRRWELGQPRMLAGILPLATAAGGSITGHAEPHWRIYFLVVDVESAGRRAEEAGGVILREQRDALAHRVLVVEDALGAVFGLVERGTGSSAG